MPKRKEGSMPDQIMACRPGGEKFQEAAVGTQVIAVAIHELASQFSASDEDVAHAVEGRLSDSVSLGFQEVAGAIERGLGDIATAIKETG